MRIIQHFVVRRCILLCFSSYAFYCSYSDRMMPIVMLLLLCLLLCILWFDDAYDYDCCNIVIIMFITNRWCLLLCFSYYTFFMHIMIRWCIWLGLWLFIFILIWWCLLLCFHYAYYEQMMPVVPLLLSCILICLGWSDDAYY